MVAVAGGSFGLEECQSWCARQGIARFKTPDRIRQFRAFPTLSLGKPDRGALAALLLADPSDPSDS